MPPGGHGHNRASNLSNPYNNYPPNYQHYQHGPSQSFHPQNHGSASHFATPPNAFNNQSAQNGHVNLIASSFGVAPVGGSFANGAGIGLGGHDAQLSFARNAALQQGHTSLQGNRQDAARAALGTVSGNARGSARIRDVWKSNLAQEMEIIRTLVDKYPYISMDTEFPGVVARPMGSFPSKADYHYQTLRINVDILKLIQLGITLFSIDGEVPPPQVEIPITKNAYPNGLMRCPCTWCFHFKFSLEDDMYAQESINLLQNAGVDFARNEKDGIDPLEFASLLITSGLVLNRKVGWISFHSGYDFGYLLKIMVREQLPAEEDEYIQRVRQWFPKIYDVKYLLRHAQRLAQRGTLGTQASNLINNLGGRSALSDLAEELSLSREGRPHTAGSDAWLTGLVFWQMRNRVFDDSIPDELVGMIWGLSGVGPPASVASQTAALAGQQTPNVNGATLYHTGMTPSAAKASAGEPPSTPQAANSGLASTPGVHGSFNHQQNMAGVGGGPGAYASSGFPYGR